MSAQCLSIKTSIKRSLKAFGICVIAAREACQGRRHGYSRLTRLGYDIKFLSKLPDEHISFALKNLKKSKSQFRQDLFVLSASSFKRNGFFVEFGATNGIVLSNTYLLEKEFGWTGILAEPARCWHRDLRKNRHCHIDTRCVWRDSDSSLTFNEVVNAAELSTLDNYSTTDLHKEARKNKKTYEVKTISLLDLLDHYNAIKQIDYLSVDTEGSEFEILAHFDFDKYQVKVITCEHNFTPKREELHKLLAAQGYVRRFEDVSQCDDWYVKM
jgi:FkbM family methyltransferase